MLKPLVLCAALFPATAFAWPTPEQALDAFVRFELSGGRLETDPDTLAPLVHAPADYETIGADTISVASTHRIGKLRCSTGSCIAEVAYVLPPAARYGDIPLYNGARQRTEKVRYRLLNRDGDWRVDAGSISDAPIVDEAALAAHLAMLQEDAGEADAEG
jgi:hypothetical protein